MSPEETLYDVTHADLVETVVPPPAHRTWYGALLGCLIGWIGAILLMGSPFILIWGLLVTGPLFDSLTRPLPPTTTTARPYIATAEDLYYDYVTEWDQAHCIDPEDPPDPCEAPWPPEDPAVYQAILDAPREGERSGGRDPGGRWDPFSRDWR